MDHNAVISEAFGPLTALIMKRKRIIIAIEETKGFRWHSLKHERALSNVEFDINWHMMTGE